jgi:hypothetical protein
LGTGRRRDRASRQRDEKSQRTVSIRGHVEVSPP